MSRILLATAIVGLGISGALFAIQNINISDSQISILDSGNNNLIAGGPFVEKISDSENHLANAGGSITDEFAKNLAQKIVDANPTGPQATDGKKDIVVPNPDQIALDLIIEAQKKFDLNNIIPTIKDSEIKIISDNSKDSVLAYTKKFDEINSAWHAGINDFDAQQEFTQENLGQNISHYNEAIKQMYALSVPQILSSFHKTDISYLRAELVLLEKINDAANDPMGALLAGQNFQKLDDEFNTKINEQIQLFLIEANKK